MLDRKEWASEFETLIDRAFGDFPFVSDLPRTMYGYPALDVYEKDGKYTVELPLPGYGAKDVNVEVNGSTVTVSGIRKDTEDRRGAKFYRREMRSGSFTRSITLPQELDTDKVDAKFEKGLLRIVLVPIMPIAPKKIAIKGE